MGGKPPAAPTAETSATTAPTTQTDTAVSRGMGTLLRGANTESLTATAVSSVRLEVPTTFPEPPRRKAELPFWFYFAADLLLVALAIGIAVTGPFPLAMGKIVFCIFAVIVGAALACIPFLLEPPHDGGPFAGARTVDWAICPELLPADVFPRQFVVHLTQPAFIGEVKFEGPNGLHVVPVAMHRIPALSASAADALAREAAEFCRRAPQFSQAGRSTVPQAR